MRENTDIEIDSTYSDDIDKEKELDFDEGIVDLDEMDELEEEELDDTYESAFRYNTFCEEGC